MAKFIGKIVLHHITIDLDAETYEDAVEEVAEIFALLQEDGLSAMCNQAEPTFAIAAPAPKKA